MPSLNDRRSLCSMVRNRFRFDRCSCVEALSVRWKDIPAMAGLFIPCKSPGKAWELAEANSWDYIGTSLYIPKTLLECKARSRLD
ncbi:hypothetical protein Scep_024313 [Stephania cephalantha]|uniref:Uncharacterized protein n=1 Tax=Stephania cephalantha TaxID=152367 RepID=A0AAP0F3G4_9MAGN